jgi:hypothetical protein
MAVTIPTTLPATREDTPGRNLPDVPQRWAAAESNATIGGVRDRLCWRGAWVITTQYEKNDAVLHANTLYCAETSNIGSTPPSVNWEAMAAAAAFVTGEVPTGAVDDVNQTFTLASTPQTGSVQLYLNGVRQQVTTHYTITGLTITMVMAPMAGDLLYADYRL